MNAKEHWRPVVGFEGLYEVSDQGRVRSLDRVVMRGNGYKQPIRGQVLIAHPNWAERPKVKLRNGDQNREVEVQKLVTEAFPHIKSVVVWRPRKSRPPVVTYADAMKRLATAEEALAWYRAQLASLTLAHAQLTEELAEAKAYPAKILRENSRRMAA